MRQTKQLTSESGIEKRSTEQSLTLKQEQTKIVGDWLTAFSALEGRNRVVDEEIIRIFVLALADLKPREIERGCAEYLRTGTRFPWPAEIRETSEL